MIWKTDALAVDVCSVFSYFTVQVLHYCSSTFRDAENACALIWTSFCVRLRWVRCLSIDMQMIECSWSLKLVQSYTHMFNYHCCTIKPAEKYCDCLFKLYRDPQLKDSFNVCWWLSTLLIVTESKFAFLWFKCCKLFSESPTRSPFKLIDVYYSLLWRTEVQQGDMFP